MWLKTTKLILLIITASLVKAIRNYHHHEAETINTNYALPVSDNTRVNKPENLVVLVLSPSELNATWEAPTDGDPPEYYRVKWYGGELDSDDVTPETYSEVSGLSQCTEYTVTVFSVHLSVESDPESATEKTDIGDPPAPINLNLQVSSSTEIVVYWEMPEYTCVTKPYNVHWEWVSLWGDGLRGGAEDANTTSKSYPIDSLTPYSNVSVCVTASSEIGYGPAACNSNITEQDAPEAPKLLSATSDYGFSEVAWESPENENGIIRSYKLTWKANTSDIDDSLDVGDVTTYTLPIIPCKSYDITVSAQTVDWGPESNANQVTIFNNVKPDNVSCTVDEKSWKMKWTSAYSCPVDNYEVSWKYHVIWSAKNGSNAILLDGTTYEFVGDALANTLYDICIVSVANDTEKSESECCQQETEEGVPGAPLLGETSQVNGRLHLTWQPPEEQNGQILFYRISYTALSNSSHQDKVVEGTQLETDVVLQPCDTYDITIAATTSKGYGDESTPENIYVGNYVLPEEVTCTNELLRTVTVSWTTAVPSCTDSAYRLDYNWTTLWSSDQASNSEEIGAEFSKWDIDGILPYSKFHSCVGIGDKLTQGACCETITEQEVPGPPANLDCSKVTNSSIEVTWSPPLEINGILGAWLLSWRNNLLPLNSEVTSYLIDNLQSNTTYNITLQASTEAGIGDKATCEVTTRSSNGNDPGNPNKAAIIGGAVGGVLGLLLIIGVIILTVKSRKRKRDKGPKKPYQNNRSSGKENHGFDSKKNHYESHELRSRENRRVSMPTISTENSKTFSPHISTENRNESYGLPSRESRRMSSPHILTENRNESYGLPSRESRRMSSPHALTGGLNESYGLPSRESRRMSSPHILTENRNENSGLPSRENRRMSSPHILTENRNENSRLPSRENRRMSSPHILTENRNANHGFHPRENRRGSLPYITEEENVRF